MLIIAGLVPLVSNRLMIGSEEKEEEGSAKNSIVSLRNAPD